MGLSKKEGYSFSVLWSIENISYNPFRQKEMLSSPSFTVHSLGATEWGLVLYPRGSYDKDYMSLYLHRKSGRPELHHIVVNIKMSVDSVGGDACFPRFARNACFKEDEQLGFQLFARISDMPLMLSSSLTRYFTIRCQLSPGDDVTVDVAKDSRLDLRTLSSDLKHLYDSRNLFDARLRKGQKEFKCHKAVLLARSPKFFRSLEFDGSVADVPFMSCHALKILLSYIYSGELEVSESEITRELLVVAEQFDLPDLMNKLQLFPSVCFARTVMNLEHKSVLWVINKIDDFKTDPSFVRFLPTPSLYLRHLLIICQIVRDPKLRSVKQLHATFRFPGFTKVIPVLLRCKILGTSTENLVLEFLDEQHLFETGEDWDLTIPLLTQNLTSLNFELNMSDGLSTSRIQDDWSTTPQSTSIYHDFTDLSKDLEWLQMSTDYSDLTVVCSGCIFHVHKAILSARSPVFGKMFEHNLVENLYGVVRVQDMRSKVMEHLMSYIYCGNVSGDLTYQDAKDLYEAADKYEVITLKEKCAAILLNGITDRNAFTLLDLAHLHFDSDLMDRITQFITRYEDSSSEEDFVVEGSETIV